jgi:hypothetical protein
MVCFIFELMKSLNTWISFLKTSKELLLIMWVFISFMTMLIDNLFLIKKNIFYMFYHSLDIIMLYEFSLLQTLILFSVLAPHKMMLLMTNFLIEILWVNYNLPILGLILTLHMLFLWLLSFLLHLKKFILM